MAIWGDEGLGALCVCECVCERLYLNFSLL